MNYFDLKYNPFAEKNHNCKACKQDWPIHTNADGGNRHHLDIIGGLLEPCPTQNWPDYDSDFDDEETIENEQNKNF